MWTLYWLAFGFGSLLGLGYVLVRWVFPLVFIEIPKTIWLFIVKGIPDIIEGAREGWRQGKPK